MNKKEEKLGFFKLYFKSFKAMLVGNLLFSIPLIIAIALVYGISLLLHQEGNILIFAFAVVLVYPFFSGVTQITKEIVKNNGDDEEIKPLATFKKGVKNNFKYFALYGLLLYMAFVISYYSIILYLNFTTKSWIFYLPLGISIIIALAILFMSFSIPMLTVTLELKLRHYFKNSALMAIGELPMNFYVLITSCVLLSAFFSLAFFTGNFIASICVLAMGMIFILPTGISYCAMYRLYPKMSRLFEIENTEEEKSFPTMPVAVPTDDDGNPIHTVETDGEGYVFVNGMMIKKSQVQSIEYIDESD